MNIKIPLSSSFSSRDWLASGFDAACLKLLEMGRFVLAGWTIRSAFCAPWLIAGLYLALPDIGRNPGLGASIATVATVQAALTGTSLVALVLAVELASSRENRDDSVHQQMLEAAKIRPMFVFTISSIVATLLVMSIGDFTTVQLWHRANQVLCSYLITALVGGVLLTTVLTILDVLRPARIPEFRRRVIESHRKEEVNRYIATRRSEGAARQEGSSPELRARLKALTELLFRGTDDALREQNHARFRDSLLELRELTSRTINDLEASEVGFQAPGEFRYGSWYPLDEITGKLRLLWQEALRQQDYLFALEMWDFVYWLIATGIDKKAGELLESGLTSGNISLAVAREAGKANGHVSREWSNLESAAWFKLRPSNVSDPEPEAEVFVRRLIEYFQEYGNVLIEANDASSFGTMLRQFAQGFFNKEVDAWRSRYGWADSGGEITVFEYSMLALLALGGRAITFSGREGLETGLSVLDGIEEMIANYSPIERFVPLTFERGLALRDQWTWWDFNNKDDDDEATSFVPAENYVMLPLLVRLLKSGSVDPLPSLQGYAPLFISAWERHREVLLRFSGIEREEWDAVGKQFLVRLQTAATAEDREMDVVRLVAPLDSDRVSKYVENLKTMRERYAVLAHCFGEAGRLKLINEDEDEGIEPVSRQWSRLKAEFVDDPVYLPRIHDQEVRFFERHLIFQLTSGAGTARTLTAQSEQLDDLFASLDLALNELSAEHCIIVGFGEWRTNVAAQLVVARMYGSVSQVGSNEPRRPHVIATYRDHWVLWLDSKGEPGVVAVDVRRWAWLCRPERSDEYFTVRVEDISEEEAGTRAVSELLSDADEETRQAKIREIRLKVLVRAEERSRFEVENPDAARMIRVVSANDEEVQSDA